MSEPNGMQYISELGFDLSPIQRQFEELNKMVVQEGITINELMKNGWKVGAAFEVRAAGGDAGAAAIAEANNQLKSQLALLEAANTKSATLGGTIKKAFAGYSAMRIGKEVLTEMREVETQMIAIARVLDLNTESTAKLRDEIFALGKEYGVAFADAGKITQAFAQAGYSALESIELAKSSLLAMNTAELDAVNSTDSMVGILKQWNLEADDLATVIDKLNYTADRNAVTTQDLVDGMLRASSAARNANISFDETIGLLTALTEASGRSGREVGNALSSIIQFTRRGKSLDVFESLGIKVYADEARQSFVPLMEMWGKLAEKVKTGGQEIVNVLNGMEGVGDLMGAETAAAIGMQEQYNELLATETRLQQENLTEVERKAVFDAASVQRQNYWIALLQNFSKAQSVANDMINAQGHSARENAAAMETLEKRYNQLKISLQELAVQAGDAGLMDIAKWAVEAAKSVTEFSKGVGGLVPLMFTLVGLWTALNQKKALKVFDAVGITGATSGIRSLIDNLRILYFEYEKAGKGAKGFAAATQLAGAEAKVAGGKIGAAFAGLGVTGWIGIAITAISAVTMGVQAYNASIEKSIQLGKELTQEFESNKKAGQDNLSTLENLKNEFDELSKGVSSTGENISLSADHYKRYKEIVAQILELQPSLIKGYDTEGVAIAENNGLMEEAIRLQKIFNQQKIDEYIAEGADKFKAAANEAKKARREILDIMEPLGAWNPNLDILMNSGNTDIIDSFGKLKGILDELNISYEAIKGNAGITTGLRIKDYDALITNEDALLGRLKARLNLGDDEEQQIRNMIDQIQLQTQTIGTATEGLEHWLSVWASQNKEYSKIGDYAVVLSGSLGDIAKQATDGGMSLEQAQVATNRLVEAFVILQNAVPYKEIEALKQQLAEGKISSEQFKAAIEDIKTKLSEAGDGSGEFESALSALMGYLNDYIVAQERTANGIGNFSGALDEAAEKAANFTDALKTLQGTADLVSDLMENGITSKNLDQIIQKYADLEDEVAAYLVGLMSESELIDIVAAKHSEDADAFTESVQAKLLASEAFYRTLLDSEAELLSELADRYGLDVNNYASAEELKAAIAAQVATDINSMTAESIVALAAKYGVDISNFVDALRSKLVAHGATETSIIGGTAEGVIELAQQYGIDVQNFAEAENAKIAIANAARAQIEEDFKSIANVAASYTPTLPTITKIGGGGVDGGGRTGGDESQAEKDRKDAIKGTTDAINDRIKALQEEQRVDSDLRKKQMESLRDLQKKATESYKAQEEAAKRRYDREMERLKAQEKAVKSRYDAEIKALQDLKGEANRQDDRADYEKSRAELEAERANMEKRTGREATERIKEIDKALAELDENERRRLRDVDIDYQIDAFEERRDAELESIQYAMDAEQKRYDARMSNIQAEAEAEKQRYDDKIKAIEQFDEIEKTKADEKIESLRKELEAVKQSAESQSEAYKKAYDEQMQKMGEVGDKNKTVASESDTAFRTFADNAIRYSNSLMSAATKDADGILSAYQRAVAMMQAAQNMQASASHASTWDMLQIPSSVKNGYFPASHTGSIVTGDGLVNLQAGEIVVRQDISDNLIRAAEMMKQAPDIIRQFLNTTTNNNNSVNSNTNNNQSVRVDMRGSSFGAGVGGQASKRQKEQEFTEFLNGISFGR